MYKLHGYTYDVGGRRGEDSKQDGSRKWFNDYENGGLGKIGAATWTLVKRASEGQIHRWEISGIGPGPIFVFKRSIKRAGHDLRLIIVPDSGQKSVRNDYRYLGDDGSDQLQIIGND